MDAPDAKLQFSNSEGRADERGQLPEWHANFDHSNNGTHLIFMTASKSKRI